MVRTRALEQLSLRIFKAITNPALVPSSASAAASYDQLLVRYHAYS